MAPVGDSALARTLGIDPSTPAIRAGAAPTAPVPPPAAASPPKPVGDSQLARTLGIDPNTAVVPPPPTPPATTVSGAFANVAAGANETIAGGLGAPVDLTTGAINLGSRGLNALLGLAIPPIQNPVGGSEWFEQHMPWLGAPNPQTVTPATGTEQALRAAGGAVASLPMMAMGGAGAAAAAPEGSLIGGIGQQVAQMPVAPAVAPVAAGAAAGQVASDYVPEPYKPLVNVVGNIAGAGLATVGQDVAGALGRVGAPRPQFEVLGGEPQTVSPGVAAKVGNRLATALGAEGQRAVQGLEPTAGTPPPPTAFFYRGAPIVPGMDTTGAQWRTIWPREVVPQGATTNQARTMVLAQPDEMVPPGTLPPLGARAVFQRPLTPEEASQVAGLTGDKPTMAELYPEPGMVGLERSYRSGYGPAFIGRANQQNQARIGAIEGLGGEGNPASPGQWFAAQLADIDQREQAAVDAARGGVTGATTAAGGLGTPEGYGATAAQAVDAEQAPRIGGATTALEQAQAERNSALASLPAGREPIPGGATAIEQTGADIRAQALLARYREQQRLDKLQEAVDPTGTAGTPAAPFQQAVAAPYARLARAAPAPTPGEQAIRDIVGGWQGNVPLSEVFGLRERVGNEISNALAPANPNRAAAARLQQVKVGLDQTLAAIVDQQVQAEQAAVASGQMAPEATTAARLAEAGNEQQAGGAGAQGSGIRSQAPGVDTGAAGRTGTAGGIRTQAGARGGLGNAADNRSLAAGTAAPGRAGAKPQSLIDFLIRRGGVQDQGGELKALDAQLVHFQKGGRLVNPRGLTPDYAREAAEEASFLKPGSTPADLYNALGEEISGRPVYRISEQAEGDARASMEREAGRNENALANARMDALIAQDTERLRLSPREVDRAAEFIVGHGMSPHEAVLAAADESQQRFLQENAERQAFGSPGIPWAEQQALGLPGAGARGPIRPMTADELAAYRRYLGAAREFQQVHNAGIGGELAAYGEHRTGATLPAGPEGEAVRPQFESRIRGGFNTADAEVVGSILRKGVTEAEAVRQATDAGIKPETLTGALADELRARAVKSDGSFDLAEYAKFRRDHAGALHVFPETLKAFDGAEAAQRTLDERQGELAAVQAGHPLRGVQPAEVMGKYWVAGDTGAARVRDFTRDTGGTMAADRALDDYAVYRLRAEGAIDKDGMVDAAALDRYRRKYQQAIAQRPTLQAKLANVEAAQRAYDTAVASRKAALDAYQSKLVQSFIDDEPMKAIAHAFERGDSGKNINELFAKMRGNRDAEAGLKRLAGQYIISKVGSLAPEAASERNMLNAGPFRRFVDNNRTALKRLFGGQGINTLEAIAANMRRSAARTAATAGSDTVPKAIGVAKEGVAPEGKPHFSGIGALVGEHVLDAIGFAHPALKVVTAGIGAIAPRLAASLRQAGVRRENELMLAALLHPNTVGQQALAFANAEKPTGLLAARLMVALQSLVAAQQRRTDQQQGATP